MSTTQGGDPEKHLAEIVTANTRLDALGIRLECAPRPHSKWARLVAWIKSKFAL